MGQVTKVDLIERHLDLLKKILETCFPNKKVWIYGSRAKGNATQASDIDMVIFDSTDREYYLLKDALNESDIPFLTQLMRWEHIPQDFKDNILECYYIVQ